MCNIRTKLSAIFFAVFLLTSMVAMCSATTVWSDDFNGELSDEWSVFGFNRTADPLTSLPGNFSTGDGTLRAYDEEFNAAQRNSTQAYGTWSFDIDLVETPHNHCIVAFISGYEPIPDAPYEELEVSPSYSYGMLFATGNFGAVDTAFVFFRRNVGDMFVIQMGEYDPDDDSTGWYEGWYHIEITRDLLGNFKVFINDTLRIEASHNAFTTSEVFYIHADAGIAIDNIVVTDEAPTTSTTTDDTTTSSSTDDTSPTSSTDDVAPPDLMMTIVIVGGIIAVVVIVIVVAKTRS